MSTEEKWTLSESDSISIVESLNSNNFSTDENLQVQEKFVKHYLLFLLFFVCNRIICGKK